MHKKQFFVFLLVALQVAGVACPACEKQQPQFTRGITHGAGPTGSIDWVIVSVMLLFALITLLLSLKYMFRPGEQDKSHIKNSIF